MPELFTEAQFALWFGVACTLWTGCWVVFAWVSRRPRGFSVAAGGPVAYLLWLVYRALGPRLDITSVSGVLVLAALFVVVGCGLGWLLSGKWGSKRTPG